MTALPPAAEVLVLGLLGLIMGSFLSVVVTRLPRGQGILWGRSACPDCGATLGPRDLVPLLSGLLSGGRCRHCGSRISRLYPALELGCLGLALWALAVVPGWLAWATAALGWALLALAVIDLRHLVLPDEIVLPLIPAGLVIAWILDGGEVGGRLLDHGIGALAGFLLILALRAAYRTLRGREGMGLGDAKLLAGAGAWVAWQGLAGLVVVAAAAGLVAALVRALIEGRMDRHKPLPFGPFIAASWWLTWLYGPLVPA